MGEAGDEEEEEWKAEKIKKKRRSLSRSNEGEGTTVGRGRKRTKSIENETEENKQDKERKLSTSLNGTYWSKEMEKGENSEQMMIASVQDSYIRERQLFKPTESIMRGESVSNLFIQKNDAAYQTSPKVAGEASGLIGRADTSILKPSDEIVHRNMFLHAPAENLASRIIALMNERIGNIERDNILKSMHTEPGGIPLFSNTNQQAKVKAEEQKHIFSEGETRMPVDYKVTYAFGKEIIVLDEEEREHVNSNATGAELGEEHRINERHDQQQGKMVTSEAVPVEAIDKESQERVQETETERPDLQIGPSSAKKSTERSTEILIPNETLEKDISSSPSSLYASLSCLSSEDEIKSIDNDFELLIAALNVSPPPRGFVFVFCPNLLRAHHFSLIFFLLTIITGMHG